MPRLPSDIASWIRSVFADANAHVSRKMMRYSITEPSLDIEFITSIDQMSNYEFSTDECAIRISVQSVSNGRHYRGRELGDIGILFTIENTKLNSSRTKGLLLQSKRLFPVRSTGVTLKDIQTRRSPVYDSECVYNSFDLSGVQHHNISDFNKANSLPVYYMLYNPWIVGEIGGSLCKRVVNGVRPIHGTYVVSADEFSRINEASVTFGACSGLQKSRIEDFVAENIPECKAGKLLEADDLRSVKQHFYLPLTNRTQ